MLQIELIGYVAGTLTTLALIPEIYTTWRKKDARDLSFYWLGSLSVGNALWAVYGAMIASLPIMAANSISFVLSLVQIALVIKYDRVKLRL